MEALRIRSRGASRPFCELAMRGPYPAILVAAALFAIGCDGEEGRVLHLAGDASAPNGGEAPGVDGSPAVERGGANHAPASHSRSDSGAADAGSTDPFCRFPFQEGSVPDEYRGAPSMPTTPADCAACESEPNNCPHDATGCDSGACALQPFCSDYRSEEERSVCTNVQRCVRQTNCAATGLVSCYCGNTDLNSCMGSFEGAVGPCKSSIVAGFPQGTMPAEILSRLTDVSVPAGGAMLLDQCDHDLCAAQCVPYCK